MCVCAYIYISGGPFSKKVAVCGVVWVAKQKELLLLVYLLLLMLMLLLLLRLLVAGLVKDSAAVVTGFGNNGDVAFGFSSVDGISGDSGGGAGCSLLAAVSAISCLQSRATCR